MNWKPPKDDPNYLPDGWESSTRPKGVHAWVQDHDGLMLWITGFALVVIVVGIALAVPDGDGGNDPVRAPTPRDDSIGRAEQVWDSYDASERVDVCDSYRSVGDVGAMTVMIEAGTSRSDAAAAVAILGVKC